MSSTAGEPTRWEDVVTRLVAERGDALTRYAFLISGNRDDASDLVQDALPGKDKGRAEKEGGLVTIEEWFGKVGTGAEDA